MLELLLQIEQNVVVSDIQFVLAPQKAHLLHIRQNRAPNNIPIRRSLPTEHNLAQSVNSGLMLPAVEGLLLEDAERLVGLALKDVALPIVGVTVKGEVIVRLGEVCQLRGLKLGTKTEVRVLETVADSVEHVWTVALGASH